MQIDQKTLLALIALVVSVCGFLVSIWSAVISHKALNHNRNSYEELELELTRFFGQCPT